jgi:hypothetical protein
VTSDLEIRVTMRHCRAVGVCASGARDWFKKNGLDFRAFVNGGLPVAEIEATGHGIAAKVAAAAREEANGRG